MKVIVSQAELASLTRKIQNIVPSKPSIPTLQNFLIEAVGGEVILSATDLSISIRTQMKAEVLEEGSIALPAKKLIPLIAELSSPLVEIQTSGTAAVITAGGSKFKMQGISKEEYPEITDLPETEKISFSANLLKELLSKTVFSAGKDEAKPILSSVFLEWSDATTAFTGTDGKRLSKAKTEIKETAAIQRSFILPLKTVDEMIRLLDSKEEQVLLAFTEDKISLSVGHLTLISSLLSGEYPNVSQIIPEPSSASIALHREELMSLLRQIILFTTDQGEAIRFSFTPGNLNLSIANGGVGEGTVNMPVNYQGDSLEIAFNPHYFLEILRHSKDETVLLGVEGPYNPGLITDSSKSLFVLMPMRIGE